MRNLTDPAVTVILDPTHCNRLQLERSLSMIALAARGVPYEVKMAVNFGRLDDSEFPALDWLESVPEVGLALHSLGRDSQAASLNTAVAAATAPMVLVLEAAVDMAPGSIRSLLEEWRTAPSDWMTVPIYEPFDSSGGTPPNGELDARTFFTEGVLLFCRRDDFLRIRGYDERTSFEKVISSDLRLRLNRAGLTHFQSQRVAAEFAEPSTVGPSAVLQTAAARAREIVTADPTIYRNLRDWSVPPAMRPVLVSVAIATRDRCEYLVESINSVLNQTIQEFEIVIVDDGSTDETAMVVESIGDPRISYHYQTASGISAARNFAADNSVGFFTAVHDDDDIMLPDRLENALTSLTDAYDASYGSWVNFDDASGDMVLHVVRDGFDSDLVAFNGQGPGHSTWLLPTALVREVRYDESYSASVDHNLATRLVWAGCRWVHTGKVAYLRRIHATQVSATDGRGQKIGHVVTRYGNAFAASRPGRAEMARSGSKHVNPAVPGRENLQSAFGAYLPDHLVVRRATFRGNVSNRLMKLGNYGSVDVVMSDRDLRSGLLRAERAYVSGIVWADMVRLRSRGEYSYEVTGTLKSLIHEDPASTSFILSAVDVFRARIEELLKIYPPAEAPVWLVAMGGLSEDGQSVFEGANWLSRLVVAMTGNRYSADIIGYRSGSELPWSSLHFQDLMRNGHVLIVDHASQSASQVASRASTLGGNNSWA